MKSEEYKSLMDSIHNKKKIIDKIEMKLGGVIEATVTFTDGSKMDLTEDDATEYLLNLKKVGNEKGEFRFKKVKDTEKYFDTEKFLYTDRDQKIASASKELANGSFKFTYNVDELQEDFLLSKNRSDAKFSPLLTDYFYIASYRLNESATILNLHERHIKNSPEYEDHFKAFTKIIADAFRNDPNFMSNFLKKGKATKINLLSTLNKYIAAIQGVQDMKPVFEPQGLKANTGVHIVLDAYRNYAEACVEPLNFLRIAYEITNGIDDPERNKGAIENLAILKPALSDHLKSYNPHLRNSESHLHTRFNHDEAKFLAEDRNYSQEFTYLEITELTNDLAHNLLPALMLALMMESQVVMLVLSYQSLEYMAVLFGVDNV